MRHRKAGRKLNRNSSQRKALMRSLSRSLIEHQAIRTTLHKAKELRRFVEPLITLAKQDTSSNRRLAFARLPDKKAVTKLFDDYGPRYKERPGGYLRIYKTGFRTGDSAPMAYVELVDRSDTHSEAELAPETEVEPQTTSDEAEQKG